MDLYSIKANEAFDHELVELILVYLAYRVPALGDVSGEFETESRLISERTYEIRVANEDETAVFVIDYEKGYGKYEPQIRIRSILLKGRYKGIGFAKGLINYLVEFCDAKKNGTTLWIVDVINREWKMYLLSQGAKLVQDETANAGAILYIPGKIGLKKKEHIYVDAFDKELIDYLTQFLKLEGAVPEHIESRKESNLIYGITFHVAKFLLRFQYEKESSAGEAQIRFELRLDDSGEQPREIPGELLVNMLNVLLLYCRVHGTMTLWVFNARALSSGWADFLIAKGATVMADNPAGFNGGTVLTIEKKLR